MSDEILLLKSYALLEEAYRLLALLPEQYRNADNANNWRHNMENFRREIGRKCGVK